jgi:hypothetical protein
MDKSPSIIFQDSKDVSDFCLFEENMFLYSTSPMSVFTEIDLATYCEEKEINNDIVKLRYKIVMKDIEILELNRKLKEFECGYNFWKAMLKGI